MLKILCNVLAAKVVPRLEPIAELVFVVCVERGGVEDDGVAGGDVC